MSIDSRSPAEKAYDAMKLSRGPIAPAAQPEDTDTIIEILESVCSDDELPADIPLGADEAVILDYLLARDALRQQAWADIVRTLLD